MGPRGDVKKEWGDVRKEWGDVKKECGDVKKKRGMSKKSGGRSKKSIPLKVVQVVGEDFLQVEAAPGSGFRLNVAPP